MLTCNLCLEMPFLPSRHSDSDSDTLDAWGQPSKSDRSTGTIPPRRFPLSPWISLPIRGQFCIGLLSTASVLAQVVIRLAVNGAISPSRFPAVSKLGLGNLSTFGRRAESPLPFSPQFPLFVPIRSASSRPISDRRPAALCHRRKYEELEEEKGTEKEKA